MYGTTFPKYVFTSIGYFITASEKGQKITPAFFKVSLNVVTIETLSNTASTATPASIFCSSNGIPNFS